MTVRPPARATTGFPSWNERSERGIFFTAPCQMCGRYHEQQDNGLCPIQERK